MTGDPGGSKKDRQPASMMGAGVALGVGIGAAIGVAMDNVGLGIGVGAAIDVAVGAALTQRRKPPPTG